MDHDEELSEAILSCLADYATVKDCEESTTTTVFEGNSEFIDRSMNNLTYQAGLKLIESYRKKDSVKFSFLTNKYVSTDESYVAQKKLHLLRTLSADDLFVLDTIFMEKCDKKLLDERMRKDEKETFRRKQEWARRYCLIRHLFEKEKKQKLFEKIESVNPNSESPPKSEIKNVNFDGLKKAFKEIGFQVEMELEDNLFTIEEIDKLYDFANKLVRLGLEISDYKLEKDEESN